MLMLYHILAGAIDELFFIVHTKDSSNIRLTELYLSNAHSQATDLNS